MLLSKHRIRKVNSTNLVKLHKLYEGDRLAMSLITDVELFLAWSTGVKKKL
jgi:hypothetical protein